MKLRNIGVLAAIACIALTATMVYALSQLHYTNVNLPYEGCVAVPSYSGYYEPDLITIQIQKCTVQGSSTPAKVYVYVTASQGAGMRYQGYLTTYDNVQVPISHPAGNVIVHYSNAAQIPDQGNISITVKAYTTFYWN
jgi:hypothetical protein